MCRILTYLGKPIVVEELLYNPDNSFIKQSYNPKYMSHLLNLAGFGMAAWDSSSHNPKFPYLYKTPQLPFYDGNLRNLASKITPDCLLAHLRGVAYHEGQIVSNQNVHPFVFSGSNVVLAHNGSLAHFDLMRYDLLEYIKPEYRQFIHGTTDSEWIYSVFISQLPDLVGTYETADIISAVLETLNILRTVRQKRNIKINSPVNLFITNGEFIAATRFVLDYGWQRLDAIPAAHSGYHSLWYTYGDSYGYYDHTYKMKEHSEKTSIIIASEPLTEDTTTWLEVPEYTMVVARRSGQEIIITSQDINL
ncbi:class II glutamine amidotransferase [Legionella quateirensis]|uniref:Glutamine amidotransferase n=1 Tax=Legionella quateirensis TaxID=45072 RepID=A0A378KPJ2_9GAMM|nr:class II glutamine amidotransferase [Legionella quateirensis]KTD44817.1 glutamine amidotransferase [Legionella quateirensis]STY16276.1 putative glutamine amidotransferase [Legionella quateirensis]